jgi:hypothetical protein
LASLKTHFILLARGTVRPTILAQVGFWEA